MEAATAAFLVPERDRMQAGLRIPPGGILFAKDDKGWVGGWTGERT